MSKFLAVLVCAAFFLAVAAAFEIARLRHLSDEANERLAMSTMLTLVKAEFEYESSHGHYADVKALAGAENCVKLPGTRPCLIDSRVANSSPASPRNDYYFVGQAGPGPETFVVAAIPVKVPHRGFCAIDDGELRIDWEPSSRTASYAGCKSLSPM